MNLTEQLWIITEAIAVRNKPQPSVMEHSGKIQSLRRAWWHSTLILALRKQRQVDLCVPGPPSLHRKKTLSLKKKRIENWRPVCLVFLVNLRSTWTTQVSFEKNLETEKETNGIVREILSDSWAELWRMRHVVQEPLVKMKALDLGKVENSVSGA